MHQFSAVLFDLDGTLANSLYDIADAMNRTLLRFDCSIYDYESYRYFVGRGLKDLVIQCLPEERRGEKEVDEVLAVMMEEYGKSYVDKTVLYDGIPELLDALVAKDYKLTVLSNKADELTQQVAEHLLSDWPFDIILGATEHFPRKPAADSALHIAGELGVAPENMLYLGDTNIDMQTANAAGMYAVGVTWGFRPRKELEENGAKMIIDFPLDLLKIIE